MQSKMVYFLSFLSFFLIYSNVVLSAECDRDILHCAYCKSHQYCNGTLDCDKVPGTVKYYLNTGCFNAGNFTGTPDNNAKKYG